MDIGDSSDNPEVVPKIKDHARNINQKIGVRRVRPCPVKAINNELEEIRKGVEQNICDDDVYEHGSIVNQHISQIKIPFEIQYKVVRNVL